MACTNIITEDGKLILAENNIEIVTEDSVCPGGAVALDARLRMGFPFDPLTGSMNTGSAGSMGG